MKHLFSSYKIKDIELKNRIVMPALASFLIKNDGSITEKTIEHYRRRAAGGPAMVIMEASAVSPEGVVSSHQSRIYDDRFTEGLLKIADAIKAEGAVAAIQLHHGGRQTSERVIHQRPLAPSPIPCPTIKGDVEPLTYDGIQKMVQKFGDAAVRAHEAGFELIEIHGAHGYLVNQFLSRFSNIREDGYGGSIEGRTRFAKEIVQEIRYRLGAKIPISFKISAQEFVEKGLTVGESIKILKILTEAGVDIVQVSAGNDATPEWICQPMFMKKGCLVDSAETIKKALRIPVMAVGRISDPRHADKILEKNQADLVCIGRGLLADPEMPRKAMEGRLDEIRICIACNTCMATIFQKGRVECLVNPALGREKEMAFVPAQKKKKIMVIGGGPSGLSVAWIAAKRGHDVHLFEKRPMIGGQLITGSRTGYKKEILSLIDFQKRQMELFGVRCHLNCKVTAGDVKTENPDVVVLATGSIPIIPAIEGIDKKMVFPFDVILNGGSPGRRQTVVIGGGPTACEVAYHLSEDGYPVTIVEMLPKIGKKLEAMTKKMLLSRLKKNNVRLMPGYKVNRIEKNLVVVVGMDRQERFIQADLVVVAVGNRPNRAVYDQIKALDLEVHRIGDCHDPRSAKEAILEGTVLGLSI